MLNIRKEVYELEALGRLPEESGADPGLIKKFDAAYRSIRRPVTDDEARVLVKLFGTDGCFGLASSLMHLIETAPGWPIVDCLEDLDNEWVCELRDRAIRGGF